MGALTDNGVFWIFLIMVLIVIWLLPTLIAVIRGTENLALVFLINLIGMPALIGWPAALILAFGPRRLPAEPIWQPPSQAMPLKQLAPEQKGPWS